eukprot:m.115748 g.115748  ORF g.115748 m.115748 type:complete len:148 (+) comp15501_c0_seq16:1074-1517(+)
MSQSDTIDRNFLAKANTLGGHTYLLTDFDAAAIHSTFFSILPSCVKLTNTLLDTTIKRLNKRYVVHPAQADHLTDLKFMFFSTLYLVVDGAVPLSRSLPVLKQTSAMQKKLQGTLIYALTVPAQLYPFWCISPCWPDNISAHHLAFT